MKNINIVKKNAFEIVSADCKFVIPVFQRNYSWTQRNFIQFWESISFIEQTKESEYFMGTISLAKRGKDIFILDGQQRLTTIFIFFIAFRNVLSNSSVFEDKKSAEDFKKYLFTDSGEFKLISHKSDRINLQIILNSLEIEQHNTGHVFEAYNFFYNAISSIYNSGKIQNAFNFLMNALSKIVFAEININDKKMEQKMFENINSTGKSLTELELILNFMLMQFDDSETQEHYFKNFWEQWVSKFGIKLKEIFKIITIILNRKQETAGSSIDTVDNENSKNIYNIFKNKMNLFLKNKNQNVFEYIQVFIDAYSILEKPDSYTKFLQPSILINKLSEYKLMSFNTGTFDPFFVYLIRLFLIGDIEERELCEYIEILNKYIFRFAITNRKINNISRKFPALINTLEENKKYYGKENFKKIITKSLFENSKSDLQKAPDNIEIMNELKNFQFEIKSKTFRNFVILKFISIMKNEEISSKNFTTISKNLDDHIYSCYELDKNFDEDFLELGFLDSYELKIYSKSFSNFFVSEFSKSKKIDYTKNNFPSLKRNVLKNYIEYDFYGTTGYFQKYEIIQRAEFILETLLKVY